MPAPDSDETRSPLPKPALPIGPERPARALVVLGVLAVSAILAATVLLLWDHREHELSRTEREMLAFTRILAEQTARAIQNTDLMLYGARERLLRDRDAGYLMDERAVHTLLRARIDSLPHVRALSLVDARGTMLASSRRYPLGEVFVGDHEPFRSLATADGDPLHIGHPVDSRIDDGRLIPVSRRLRDANGGFAGLLTAALAPEYFSELYRSLRLGPGRSIALFMRDGTPIASTDEQGPSADSPIFAELAAGEEGEPEPRLHRTGTRYYACGVVHGYPLVVVVSVGADEALAEWHADAYPIAWGAAGVVGILGLATLVLARVLARGEALSATLRKFSRVIDQTASTIVITDPRGVIEYVNPRFVETTGYTAEEALGKQPNMLKSNHTSPEQYKALWDTITRGRVWHGEFHNRRKDGSLYWESAIISPVRDEHGAITHFVAVKDDITERKRAADALHESHRQLREMAATLNSLREEEMVRIARELHDELGQKLTGLKMDLSWLEGRLGADQPALQEKVSAMKKLIDATVKSVRRISTGLRPLVLDDLGPIAALEWLADDFSRHSNIRVALDLDMEELDVDERTATAIFRIVQESLTNVARHAAAGRVEVSLQIVDGQLLLRVTDDGRGMPDNTATKGFGLVGIRERAYMCGGQFEVQSAAGCGTTIAVSIPLSTEEEQEVVKA